MRLVLDTNVVLDLVVFEDPGTAPLRASIEAGRVAVYTNRDCVAELRRVLAYPRFGLGEAAQKEALHWFETHAQTFGSGAFPPALPRCSDLDDQKFLELAWAAQADFLVTKDKALLELARRVARLGRFLVSSPTDLRLPAL